MPRRPTSFAPNSSTRWSAGTASPEPRSPGRCIRRELRQPILEAISRPGRETPQLERIPQYLPDRVAHRGWGQLLATTCRNPGAGGTANIGVPPQIIVAILGVETRYGATYRWIPRARCAAHAGFPLSASRQVLSRTAQPFPALCARGKDPGRPCRPAPTPAPWASRSSCPTASASTRSISTVTDAATSGTTPWTSSAASPTISPRRASGRPGEPVTWPVERRHRGPQGR